MRNIFENPGNHIWTDEEMDHIAKQVAKSTMDYVMQKEQERKSSCRQVKNESQDIKNKHLTIIKGVFVFKNQVRFDDYHTCKTDFVK